MRCGRDGAGPGGAGRDLRDYRFKNDEEGWRKKRNAKKMGGVGGLIELLIIINYGEATTMSFSATQQIIKNTNICKNMNAWMQK